MKILIYLLCAVVLLKVLNFILVFISLGYKKTKVYNLFLNTDKLIKSSCHLLYQIIPNLQNTSESASLLKVSDRISKLLKLDDSYDNIDRKIAVSEMIFADANNILLNNNLSESNKNVAELINQYTHLQEELDNRIQKYNKAADKLRRCTDVFPGSYIARMRKIYPVDTFKS